MASPHFLLLSFHIRNYKLGLNSSARTLPRSVSHYESLALIALTSSIALEWEFIYLPSTVTYFFVFVLFLLNRG
jgi:hypothetical protein